MWVKHKKLILAVFGSVLIHALLLATFAVLLALEPPVPSDHPATPIRLQIVHNDTPPPELPAPATPPPQHRQIIETQDMQKADRPPEKTLAESDKDTADRSELAANGPERRPAQEGKIRPRFAFDTHPYVAADSAARPLPVATPVPETAPPLPRPDAQAPRPVATPAPPPTPAPTAAPTPAPTAAPDEFALVEATPTPKPVDFDPFVRAPETEPPKPTPVAAAAAPSRTLSAEEKTRIRGDLSNRGPSSMASMATPEGRYTRLVSDAIKVRWYAKISTHMDLASFGTVKIHFIVDRRGKVIAPHVVSNTGNEALASLSLQAILDASIPPVPAELAATNNSRDLPLDFDFSLY